MDTGIFVEVARFKPKQVKCHICGQATVHHEEKETDVAIATKLMELAIKATCDTVVVMTGDTDLAPAVRMVQRLFPQLRVVFAFPFGRKNNELAKLAPGSFKLKRERYSKNQFPDPYMTQSGKAIGKPTHW